MIFMKNFLSRIVSYNFYLAENTHLHFFIYQCAWFRYISKLEVISPLKKKTTQFMALDLHPL